MKSIQSIIIAFSLLMLAGTGQAQSWTSGLERGGVVSVDPVTNKATIYSSKGSTQLWDGTHELNDGSVIIVHDGVVTSGGGGGQQTDLPPIASEPGITQASSACVELVIKVCGFNGECSENQSCSPARQLMELEKDEAWQTRSKGPNKTSAECRTALANEKYFTRCGLKRQSEEPTACENLVSRVCGAGNQCPEAPACSPARQLLTMETQERLASRTPDQPTFSSKRCQDVMQDSKFFKPCTPEPGAGSGGGSGTSD